MECSEEIKKDPEAGAKWLVAEFGDRLFAVARRLGLNDYDAEDLVFRVLSQALAKIGTFDGKSSIYTWLYAIMMNFRRMDLRSRAANVLVPMAEVPESVDESPDPGEVLANISDAAALHAAVEALPETYREVVVFRYFEDLSMNDIAQILGIPCGTVRFRLCHAKRLLRAKLAPTFELRPASKGVGKMS